jgi:hypothetical protein
MKMPQELLPLPPSLCPWHNAQQQIRWATVSKYLGQLLELLQAVAKDTSRSAHLAVSR